MSRDLAIKIQNLSKVYKLGRVNHKSFQQSTVSFLAKLLGRDDPNRLLEPTPDNDRYDKQRNLFWALRDISLEIKKGDRVGFVGPNGAGKSTLLKLISRITSPTFGQIGINGRVGGLLEVGTGFHQELTGKENIFLAGAIQGMPPHETKKKLDQIIEFSELSTFIDTPVKRYSSGMYVKLGFSVAAHLDPDVLILDEVLAVGDIAFQKKCIQKVKDITKDRSRTILFVSHNQELVETICDYSIQLNEGRASILK